MQETLWVRGFRRAIEACWLLVFAVVPVFFSLDVFINFIHDKIPLFRALVELGLLTAVLGGLIFGVRPRRLPLRAPLAGATAAFTVTLLLATFLGRNPVSGWWGDYPRLFGSFTLLHGVLLFGLMAGYLTSAAERWRWTAAVLAAAAAVSLYAIAQRTGHDPYQWSGPIGTNLRPVSTLGNASCLGAYLVFTIPLTLGAMLALRGWLARGALGTLLLLELAALAFSQTRGAWLGTGALLVVFGLLLGWRRGHARLAVVALALGAAAAAVVVTINLRPGLVAHVHNPYVRRIASMRETQPGSSGWERLMGWQIALEAARGRALLFGSGPQSYVWIASHAYRPIRSDYGAQGQLLESSHNIFLDTLVERGLLGLGALLALLGIGFATGLRALRRVTTPADEGLLLAALSALAGYIVQGIFFFDQLITLLFVMGFLAIILAISESLRAGGDGATEATGRRGETAGCFPWPRLPVASVAPSPARPWSLTAAALATALIGWCVMLNVNDYRADAAKLAGVTKGPDGQRDLDAAERSLRLAVGLCPWQAAYQEDLAELLVERAGQSASPDHGPLPEETRRQLTEAESSLRQAIRLEPADYRPYLFLGQLYAGWARYEPACAAKGIQAFHDAVATSPGRQQLYWSWGEYYLALGQSEAAVDCYRRAVALDPSVDTPHRMLGLLYVRLKRAQPAEQEYQLAWSLEHKNPIFATPEGDRMRAGDHEMLADLYLEAGAKQRAIAHLRASVALDDSNERVQWMLAGLTYEPSQPKRVEG